MKTEIEEEHFKLYKQVTFRGQAYPWHSFQGQRSPEAKSSPKIAEKRENKKRINKRLEKVKIGDTRAMSHTKTHAHPYLPTSAPPFLGLIFFWTSLLPLSPPQRQNNFLLCPECPVSTQTTCLLDPIPDLHWPADWILNDLSLCYDLQSQTR